MRPPLVRPGGRFRVVRTLLFLVALGIVAASCASDDLLSSTDEAPAVDGPRRGDYSPDLYDPTESDEQRPEDYRESLPRDAINPVYAPSFVAASGVDWPEDELVIGIEIDGEARAYPVGFLTRREIVNDTQRGIPTMVTW